MSRRRFIIAVADLTAEEEKKLRSFLGENGAWWHWIDNLWLFTTKRDTELSTNSIKEQIKNINSSTRSLVMEIPEDISWAIRAGDREDANKMAKWLRSPWGTD